jgi:hypothetical protein
MMNTGLQIALLVAAAFGTIHAAAPPATRPLVLFASGWAGAGTDQTLLVPVVCYKPGLGLVSAATTDCLSLVPRDATVALDSGTILSISGKGTATCTGDDGQPNGAPRQSLAVSGERREFSYAVWPASAGSLITPVSHSRADHQPADVPPRELSDLRQLARRYARGEVDVLQRIEGDLDGDGQVDIAYSIDVRCTKREMQARAGCAGDDCEPWSCFNGLLVRWGGTARFAIVTKDWHLGRVEAVFDWDGDRHPEVLVFAWLDDGFKTQVFSIDKRKLKPLEPWCCGCAETNGRCRPTRR